MSPSTEDDGSTISSRDLYGIDLLYGSTERTSGPFLRIFSRFVPERIHRPWSPVDELEGERGRLFRDAGIDEPDPPGQPVPVGEAVVIDRVPTVAEVWRHGDLWVGRADLSKDGHEPAIPLVVTIVARGLNYEGVQFTFIEDLRPFLEQRRRMIEETLARGLQARSIPFVPLGVDVNRAFLEACLRLSGRSSGAVIIGRAPTRRTRPRVSLEEYRALRQAAVESLSPIKRRNDAYGAVASMADQVSELATYSSWFDEDDALQNLAIDETLAHVVHGDVVSSQRAQEAWEVVRGVRSRPQQRLEIDRLTDAQVAMLRDAGDSYLARVQWLSEWELWARRVREEPTLGDR